MLTVPSWLKSSSLPSLDHEKKAKLCENYFLTRLESRYNTGFIGSPIIAGNIAAIMGEHLFGEVFASQLLNLGTSP
jgi:hypothetical protein